MNIIPKTKRPKSITVAHFFHRYGESLKMELLGGSRGINRPILEGRVNRPAFALTGFFKFFSNKGLQIFGAAEMAYLKTLSEEEQFNILMELAKRTIPCLILTRNYLPTPAMERMAKQKNLPLLRTSMITRHFINAATVFMEQEFAPRITLHGTLMEIKGIGTLIRGKSGVGKSECALALVERGHSLVADDLTYISLLNEQELMGESSELNRGYMECRGIGIINVREMFGIRSVRREKRVDLVVNLIEWEAGMNEDRTGLEENFFDIHGIPVPLIEIPVRPGRDMARLVEVAALSLALKNMGHDSAKVFNERLIAHMQKDLPPE
ncbi:MAG: HPr(Ser) kinase/phosphatase [Opitutales bacterium]|nr:HPr(Ser) kinase/phosphatase [Opitutales bacterium]